jgi:NAD(P)-dependent dehydrogenase (short-subunit alcohol dehydrogenase family)
MRLCNLKAVVTGSGGSMGGHIALGLAREGADVMLNDRIDGLTQQFLAPIRALGRDVASVTSNVTKREGAKVVIDAALERWGRIDILVNTVGGIKGKIENPIWETSEEEWEFAIGLNLRGTFHCTQLALPTMMANRFGKIINIASTSWSGEPPIHAHYSAAKAGVIAFTRAAASQLGPFNININAVAPGATVTPGHADTAKHQDEATLAKIPLRRLNDPSDIANAVVFLASEDARNISGQLLTVSGGWNPSL